MGIGTIDKQINRFYAQRLLKPITFCENGIFCWFPGSGMTSTVQRIFTDKALLDSFIPGFAKRMALIQLWGHISTEKSCLELIKTGGFRDEADLVMFCKTNISKGKEVVLVCGCVDNFPDKVKIETFKLLSRIVSINKGRIHILINSTNKPWIEKTLKLNSEMISLANNFEIMPLISGDLLKKYIVAHASNYKFNITNKIISEICSSTGGILLLTKEFIRSNGSTSNLILKLQLIWNDLPESYKEALQKKYIAKEHNILNADLKLFGVDKLRVFDNHPKTLVDDPYKLLPSILTQEEANLWRLLMDNQNKILSKDQIIDIIRPNSSENISLWAIDQAMSRFRKKLARAGIDPEILRTVKKKGYIWKG